MIRNALQACKADHTSDAAAPADAEDIRAAFERLAQSAPLRTAPRLLAFLRYVVEATLAGKADRIKSYTIAVEALGRDWNFDPQTDAIVRVEAGRLRQALALYYAGVGRNDPIVLELPRGGYVPLFRRQASGEPSTSPGREGSHVEAALDTMIGRLGELRSQIETITTEIEVARDMMLEPFDRLRPQRK